MPRPSLSLRIAFAFAFALACVAHLRSAHADSGGLSSTPSAQARGAARSNDSSLRGFDVLASAGWGASTGKILQLQLEPYGASFGIDLGYTWSSGFRLGGYFANSLGQVKSQHREPELGREYDFDADTSSVNGGLSIGWDVPVYALVLRYSLGFGVTVMSWEVPAPQARSVNIGNGNSPTPGMHFAPGIALFWPYRWFEVGAGFDYLAQVKDTIPSGVVGKLLIGVRP